MAGLVRRNRKIVNYSEFGDFEDGDEDFACIAAPLTKKSRTQPKEPKKEKKKKQETQKKSTPSQKQTPIGRTSLDDSFCEKDLNVTLALSIKEKSENIHEVQNSKEQDEESEEDSDYSEGNGEDCAVEKMKIEGNKEEIKKQTGKEKKTKSDNNTTVTEQKSEQAEKKISMSSEPVGRPLCTSSTLTNKNPKWVVPVATGRNNISVKYASVKSPTQCLRLGLSRLARVKPLHPSATSR